MIPDQLQQALGYQKRTKTISCESNKEEFARSKQFLSDCDQNNIQISTEDLAPSYYQTVNGTPSQEFGCKHYKTNCKFLAECCKKWFPCRFCHNECTGHEVDRYLTRLCLCMYCGTAQPASQTCVNPDCAKSLAFYYCDHCKFWDNDPQKKIFHCDKCGVCRAGTRDRYIHCDKCNACLAEDIASNHKCIERSLECNCPICGEFLFTTILPLMFMPCGHAIHFFCHREHLQNSYQCPVCLKSVTDMSHFFNQIDLMLTNHVMPPEYDNVLSSILCNDCEMKSDVKFHFVYHKCAYCKSYNTKVLNTFNVMEDDPTNLEDYNDLE